MTKLDGRSVEISVDRMGYGTVVIDGVDISKACHSFTIESTAGRVTAVGIRLLAPSIVAKLTGDIEISSIPEPASVSAPTTAA